MRLDIALAILVITVGQLGVARMASAQDSTPRSVLTIHWSDETFPVNPVLDAAIRGVLLEKTDVPVNYYAEYLETESTRVKPETASLALRDYLRQKFGGVHFDVVIATASPALEFVLRHRDELFTGVPIVFAGGLLPSAVSDGRIRGVTGVLNDSSFVETLEVALELHPSTRRIYIVGRAKTAENYDERVLSALQPFSRRVELRYIRERALPDLLDAVKNVPADSLILYTRYTPQDADSVVYTDEVARRMAEVSPVPIYAATDAYMGTGVVGGVMRSVRTTGTRVGEIARQILHGTNAETIPIEAVRPVPTFDWRQLQRWHITPSRLPADAVILFRKPTPWEMYREYVLATIVILGAQLALITALLAQRERRRRAERTIREREATVRRSYERIRHLARQLINAQDDARASLARDLHDDLCQRLVCLNMTVVGLKQSRGRIQDSDAQEALAELEHDMNSMFDGIRRLSHELHPATLPVLGLAPTLKSYCREMEKHHNIEVRFITDGDLRRLRPDIAVTFFRIAQEALRNAANHAAAKHVSVSLIRSGEHVELSISDDGCGFDVESVRHDGNGLGVVSMEERAHAIGADIHIVSAPQQGTTVRVRSTADTPAASAERGLADGEESRDSHSRPRVGTKMLA
jgi:signal transduction histidine kinase